MKTMFVACFTGIVALACVSCRSIDSKTTAVLRRYDFSSPRGSFNSFQRAIRDRDLDGMILPMWQICRRWNKTEWYRKGFQEVVGVLVQGMADQPDPWRDVDSHVAGGLKLTEAHFIREVERKQDEGAAGYDDRVTVCRILIGWPERGKAAEIYALNFENTENWWVWTMFDPNNPIKIFNWPKDGEVPNNNLQLTK